MAKFLFVYRSDKSTFDEMEPEELHHFHAKWQSWIAEGMRTGWMIDASTALKTEGRVVNARKAVTVGPLVEAGDVVRGYVNLQADTLDSAAELAKGCPVLLHGGSVEIRPFWEGVFRALSRLRHGSPYLTRFVIVGHRALADAFCATPRRNPNGLNGHLATSDIRTITTV